MYRIAVCEDEEQTRQEVCVQCRQAMEMLGISGEVTPFSCAEELEAALRAAPDPFDLLVLDIQLGGKTGLELARDRRKLDDQVNIIFITNCEAYIPKGYAVRPILFLMKPLSPAELREAIQPTKSGRKFLSNRLLLLASKCRESPPPAFELQGRAFLLLTVPVVVSVLFAP